MEVMFYDQLPIHVLIFIILKYRYREQGTFQ